ncbi:MAG: SGNH/GDSL hydrolase family protein [Ruminococcaceae bacterium]|nr:SGNH/GDSL hydrolase family protein [Oscillospiraceae bacterium]
MKLTYNQIKDIIRGAVRVVEDNGVIRLYRFTRQQEELYKTKNSELYFKTFSSSGIKLIFRTNSKKMTLNIETSKGSSRGYFSVDVVVDGKLTDCLDNYSFLTLPHDYTGLEFPEGEFKKEFNLGEGEKNVCVHLPWSVSTAIKEIEIDDGAFIKAVTPKKKLLVFGDSITQGYDALHPSNRYIAKLAEKLEAEEFNKAIGGEKFFPSLAALKDSFTPDYITVSYGSNDWKRLDRETFKNNCRQFFENLNNNYPEVKIYAITPIWRKDMFDKHPFGDFCDIEKLIRECVKDIENITVISGFDFVPKDEKYFADLRLHPNDEGFEYYSENLFKAIGV